MFFWSYKDVFQRYEYQLFKRFTFVRGVGGGGKLSRLVYLAPAQDLGQTVPSVNSYCTIILEYLVVWDINIIWIKLKCLHLMFSLVILVRGMGGKLSRLVYLAPAQNLGQTVPSVNSYCTIILEYLVVWDINWRSWIIFPYRRTNHTLTIACSMTFYFSFEVLLKLKSIQRNIKGGEASNRE